MIHVVSLLKPFVGSAGAALCVSLMSGVSLCGRFIVGSFVDRVDKRFVAVACFLMQGCSVYTIAHAAQTAVFYICVIAFGMTMGNIIMIQSLIIGECFGMVSFGRVSGLIMMFTSFGSAFGPMIAGILFDTTGSYGAGFTVFAIASMVASAVILLTRPPLRGKSPRLPDP